MIDENRFSIESIYAKILLKCICEVIVALLARSRRSAHSLTHSRKAFCLVKLLNEI